MKELEMDLLSKNYTTVFEEDSYLFNAPHRFWVYRSTDVDEQGVVTHDPVYSVKFQEGPVREHGVNGANNEDLLCMVLRRLQCFQDSEYACRENALAITKIEEALLWLRKRTINRQKRGVIGTSEV